MVRKITGIEARPDFSVELSWSDGSRSVVNFWPMIETGEVMEPLRDPAYFASHASVIHGGQGVGWPNEVDFCADALWFKTHPEDYRRDFGEQAAE
jgi:hypothetical protein